MQDGCVVEGQGSLELADAVSMQCTTNMCQFTFLLGGNFTLNNASSVQVRSLVTGRFLSSSFGY